MIQALRNLREPQKLWRIFILLGLGLLVVIVFAQKIEFSSIDLGRHLENGRLVFEHHDLLFKNFYSYTEPDYPFINHHWLAGLIFYAVFLLGGFKLLSLFNIALALAVFFSFFKLAYRRAGFYLPAVLSIPVILLLGERVEIRPEIFSYLFLAFTWLVWENKQLSVRRKLLILIPLFVVWANIHIYFFLGLALIGFKLAAGFLRKFLASRNLSLKIRGQRAFFEIKSGLLRFLLLAAACFLTPNTWRGFFYPFNILRNYGYQIAENKSIFYLQNLVLNYNFDIFKLLLVLLIIGLVANWFFRSRAPWFDSFWGVFIALLALFASRNLALFALVSLVLLSSALKKPLALLQSRFIPTANNYYLNIKKYAPLSLVTLILIVFLVLRLDSQKQHQFLNGSSGIGLNVGELDSFKFFKDNGLSGPIFNNYDGGSALIFGFDNQTPVFVDNRPEAYSPEFFSDVYLPMQNDAAEWKNISAQYNFKTIFFAYKDQTPWGKAFLSRILADREWSLVYFDRQYVILARQGDTDPAILDKYTIDSWEFRGRLRQLAENSDIPTQFYLAYLAQSYGMPDLAEEIYQKILIGNSNDVKAIFSLAYLYSSFSDRNVLLKSISYFDRGLDLEKREPGAYSSRALVYWNLGDYRRAEASWRQALKINHRDVDALYYLPQVADLKKRGLLPRE